MDRTLPRAEVADLAERLLRYQYEYYVLGAPTVSDAEYDALLDRLERLEREHPELQSPDSPVRRVGSDLTNEFPEVRHSIPVLSLDKAYDAADVGAWMRKVSAGASRPLGFVFEEKIDGAAVVLYYEEGRLARAVTRGNGFVGNDVTENVRTIGAVPLRLSRAVDIAVRGEVFLPRALFDRINLSMEVPYANPRNLAAGTLRRVKSAEVAKVPLDMFVYEGFATPAAPSHVSILEELHGLGFKVNERIGFYLAEGGEDAALDAVRSRHPTWLTGHLDSFAAYLDREREDRPTLPYDIDGIVLKVDDIAAREALGYTGHHPKWALAFKFDAPFSVSVVTAIDVQVGRTGRVTPVARVEPVRISGSTVSNVTLHNQEYVDLLELAVGDTVAISKRGDIIPAVERVVEKNWDRAQGGESTWKMPERCPACGAALIRVGAHTFCPDAAGCPAQLRGRLAFFAARDQMDIQSLGPETIDVLFERGLVRDLPDLYTLDVASLLAIPGFGEKKAELIRAGILASKAKPFRVVLPSLGIPELAQKVAELLLDAGFRRIDDLFALADAGDPAPLLRIHGIGEKTAARILAELSRADLRDRIGRLRVAGLRFDEPLPPPDPGAAAPGVFAGSVWCVTGTFQAFAPRELAIGEIRKRGGRVSSTVTAKTTHLLAGEGSGSKLARAREMNVTVVDEAEFVRLLAAGAPREGATP
jgi:DNA ligase (NAD+)